MRRSRILEWAGLGLIAVTLAETDQRVSSERAQELRAALTDNA